MGTLPKTAPVLVWDDETMHYNVMTMDIPRAVAYVLSRYTRNTPRDMGMHSTHVTLVFQRGQYGNSIRAMVATQTGFIVGFADFDYSPNGGCLGAWLTSHVGNREVSYPYWQRIMRRESRQGE